eukprot:1829662-Amphidinium_carterae.2
MSYTGRVRRDRHVLTLLPFCMCHLHFRKSEARHSVIATPTIGTLAVWSKTQGNRRVWRMFCGVDVGVNP